MARIAQTSTAASPAEAARRSGLRSISFAINPAHVRLLLWLRLKLTLRGYARSWQRVVGLIFGLLFLIPLAGGLTFLTATGYTDLGRPAATQLLFGVVALLYLIWAVLPLLQYSLNEGLDVTKLQIYPLTRGEQMVSLVLATFFDLGTLFLLALYAAAFIGWHATPVAAAFTLVALAIAYVHTVSLSQLVLAALMGLLRSRRFRDLSIIIFALFGTICSFSNQIIARLFTTGGSTGEPPDVGAALASAHLDQYLRWTPPGMAAQSIVLADRGDYLAALPWLLSAALLVPIALYLWAVILDRGITNAESAGAGGRRGRRRAPAAVALAANGSGAVSVRPASPMAVSTRKGWRPLSRVAVTIAWKDVRYFWRDPQLKAALISVLFATVFILVPGLFAAGSPDSDRFSSSGNAPWTVLLAPLPALFVVVTFGLNALGMDRQGLQILFLLPVRPLDILWGKNIFVGVFAFALASVLTAIKAATTSGWQYVPLALAGGLAAILVMLGCGNVTSVITPFRWRQMRMGESSSLSSENGCLRAVISLVALIVTVILLIPVAIAMLIPLALQHREWLTVSLPLAVAYGLALHQVASRLIAPVLLRRVPEILAVTVREV